MAKTGTPLTRLALVLYRGVQGDDMGVPKLGMLRIVGQYPAFLTAEQRQILSELHRSLASSQNQEEAFVAEGQVQEFLKAAGEKYIAELQAQFMNVMLHPPAANEGDEVLDTFLSNNPLVTKVELFRLLIQATQSARTTFSNQRRKRSTAGKAGGRSTPKNIAASKLKEWVDNQKPTINRGAGGVRAAARRLTKKAPVDFWNSLDDVQRVIENHLKTLPNNK